MMIKFTIYFGIDSVFKMLYTINVSIFVCVHFLMNINVHQAMQIMDVLERKKGYEF